MHDTLVDISAGQAPRLKSFSLTHFQYQDGDHFGMLLALISLAPIFLIVSETSIILSRREMAGVLLLLGQLLNELLNLIIKLIIREPRPHEHLGDGYGMPSSHAQFMGFFVVYVVVYLETRVVMHQVHRRVVQAGSLVLGGLVLISRVYLGYHTVRQVLAGAIVGAGTGAVWYALVENWLRSSGAVDWAVKSSMCRWLLVRDSRDVPNIVLAEYNLSISAKPKVL